MFGTLLRSQLIQGSASKTWDCVLRFANYFWSNLNPANHITVSRDYTEFFSRFEDCGKLL